MLVCSSVSSTVDSNILDILGGEIGEAVAVAEERRGETCEFRILEVVNASVLTGRDAVTAIKLRRDLMVNVAGKLWMLWLW